VRIFRGHEHIKGLRSPVVAIGIFDGIHKGHKKVLENLFSPGYSECDKVVITFDPHPREVLKPDLAPPRIMSLGHRLRFFEKMGIDAVVVIKFDAKFAEEPPEEFVKKILFGKMKAKAVYVGANFRFGKGHSGDVRTLSEVCERYGIAARHVPPVKVAGVVASSTALRRLISTGRILKAADLLGRPVSVYGTVVGGDKVGRRLGFPTANVDPHHEVIPPPGVYAITVGIGAKVYGGVLNIGFNPTFYGTKLKKREEPRIEVNIFGYSGDLYGRDIEVFFVKRIRAEKKFKTADELVAQIRKDRTRSIQIIGLQRNDGVIVYPKM
jgi:riboflavin kinase/FMN adenylyltransferase